MLVTNVDLQKYSNALSSSTNQDLKHPFMFLGHRKEDLGQIWLLSESEGRWVIYSEGSFDMVKQHWEDTKEAIRTDEYVAAHIGVKNDYPVVTASPNTVMASHLKIQNNCWLDLECS